MTRLSRPVAIRAIACFATAASALVALAGPGEANMLRDDCFTEIIAACNQNINVDAAHQCVIHRTNSCQEIQPRMRPHDPQRIRWPVTHRPRVLDTLYSRGEAAAGPQGQGAQGQGAQGQGAQGPGAGGRNDAGQGQQSHR